MAALKFNIFKKITLGLLTIICTCMLYSTANAGEDIIDHDGIIILQEEASINAVSVNSNIDNMPNDNTEMNTDEVKESATNSANRKLFVVAGVIASVLVGFGSREVYSRFKKKREAYAGPNWVM